MLTNGTLTWTGGTMSGVGGTTRIESGGTLIMGGTADRLLIDRALDNQSVISWTSSGALLMGGTSTLTNAARSNINLAADMAIRTTGTAPTPSLVNSGSLTKAGGTGLSAIGIPLTNNGTVIANSGAFSFSNGGQTSKPALTNNGQLTPSAAPTATPTQISVSGDYIQGATGVLNLDIDGATCANSDVLNVTGTATLASGATLNVSAVAPCASPNQRFTVLQTPPNSPINGTFTTVSLPPAYVIHQTPPTTSIFIQFG